MNTDIVVKCKLTNNLGTALKKILEKQELTQQDVLEKLIKNYILENLILITETDKK